MRWAAVAAVAAVAGLGTRSIVGDADRTAPADSVAGLASKIPGARVSRYGQTGHMPFIERRERFDRELGEFVRSVSPPRAGRPQGPAATGP